jgi:hypothetical protein
MHACRLEKMLLQAVAAIMAPDSPPYSSCGKSLWAELFFPVTRMKVSLTCTNTRVRAAWQNKMRKAVLRTSGETLPDHPVLSCHQNRPAQVLESQLRSREWEAGVELHKEITAPSRQELPTNNTVCRTTRFPVYLSQTRHV